MTPTLLKIKLNKIERDIEEIDRKISRLLILFGAPDPLPPVSQDRAGEVVWMPENEDYVLDPSGDYSLDGGQTWERRH